MNVEQAQDDRPGAVDPGHEMVSSLRVEGTPVFDSAGKKLGSVHSLMIGKLDGVVRYALLSFGGWFGIATHVYPVPWQLLRFDVDRNGYVVDLTRDQLENAPTLTLDETDRPIDRSREQEMTSYWGTLPWWGL